LYFTIAAAWIGVAAAAARADDAVPQAIAEEEAEGVITVRAIDRETREVKVEDAAGNVFMMKVPPEAHNLAQIRAGVDERVEGPENIKRGDSIVVRYTEAVGLTMIEQ
jgi:hypothetical protein